MPQRVAGRAVRISPSIEYPGRRSLGPLPNVDGQPVELGHNDRALRLPPSGQCCGQLGPSVQSIAAFAGLDLDKLGRQVERLGCGEAGHGFTLGFDAEP